MKDGRISLLAIAVKRTAWLLHNWPCYPLNTADSNMEAAHVQINGHSRYITVRGKRYTDGKRFGAQLWSEQEMERIYERVPSQQQKNTDTVASCYEELRTSYRAETSATVHFCTDISLISIPQSA